MYKQWYRPRGAGAGVLSGLESRAASRGLSLPLTGRIYSPPGSSSLSAGVLSRVHESSRSRSLRRTRVRERA